MCIYCDKKFDSDKGVKIHQKECKKIHTSKSADKLPSQHEILSNVNQNTPLDYCSNKKDLKESKTNQSIEVNASEKSKDGYVEYSLPFGWKKVGHKRKSSISNPNGKLWDMYVFSPDGKRFRSTVKVMRYLELNPHISCDLDVTNCNRPKDSEVIQPKFENSQTQMNTLSEF